MPETEPDIVQEAISRDTRFAALHTAIAIETDLRDNPTINALMKAVWEDALQAMDELSETSPMNHEKVSLLLVRVKTQVYIRNTLNRIIQRGKIAEAAIRAEDQMHEAE